MLIAIASGKGGTGKTTVAVNLALAMDGDAVLADCDVEEPNSHLFLQGELQAREDVCLLVPEVDASLCTGCGACARFCQYSAIVSFGTAPLLFPEMCHGCGGCAMVCPTSAIREVPRAVGVVEHYRCALPHPGRATSLTLVHGQMAVGEAMAPPVIRAVCSLASRLTTPEQTLLLDSPPGTACPAAATVRAADYAVLVTEPTAFGLHDLRLAVEMARELQVPCGVVINRDGCGDDRVHRYCHEEGVTLLATIPDDRRVAEAYSRGIPAVSALPEYRDVFRQLHQDILTQCQKCGRGADSARQERNR